MQKKDIFIIMSVNGKRVPRSIRWSVYCSGHQEHL